MRLDSPIRHLIARIEAATSGYLAQSGWFTTRATRLATGPSGEPIPWFTYPGLCFLEARIKPKWRVLEFGAGQGTLWWSGKVTEVLAIEHVESWATRVRSQCTAQVLLGESNTSSGYIRPALGTGTYDVVIVDGLFRNECLRAALQLVTPDGIIILDDAQRDEYGPGVEYLLEYGFRRLDFHGPQPVSKHPGCTTVLYRDANVVGL